MPIENIQLMNFEGEVVDFRYLREEKAHSYPELVYAVSATVQMIDPFYSKHRLIPAQKDLDLGLCRKYNITCGELIKGYLDMYAHSRADKGFQFKEVIELALSRRPRYQNIESEFLNDKVNPYTLLRGVKLINNRESWAKVIRKADEDCLWFGVHERLVKLLGEKYWDADVDTPWRVKPEHEGKGLTIGNINTKVAS